MLGQAEERGEVGGAEGGDLLDACGTEGSITLADERDLDPHRRVPPGLVGLVAAVRSVVSRHADWRQTVRLVLDEERGCLVEAGAKTNRVGDVSGFAPPGDIHRVRNVGDRTAISLHVYGTDVSRIGSSVRRYSDQPMLAEH